MRRDEKQRKTGIEGKETYCQVMKSHMLCDFDALGHEKKDVYVLVKLR
jgi:hypothetical protein